MGLVGSCSPSWTGSRGVGRAWGGGLNRGKMDGKLMWRRGERLLLPCRDRDPALAMPVHIMIRLRHGHGVDWCL